MIVTALLYGRSGTGKTTIAGSFPGPILFVDIAERGTDSLDPTSDTRTLAVSTWDELEEVYWALKDEEHGYKTVVIDALHTMQNLAVMQARDISGKKANVPTSQRDFGQASGLMNQWIYNFRDLQDLGINVVFLAHDRIRKSEDEDDESDSIAPEVGANVMPGVNKTIMGAVNVIGYTYIREKVTKKMPGKKPEREMEYCLRVGPHAYYATKIRSPKENAIPEYIVDPSYDKIVSVIKGSATGSATTSRRIIKKVAK